MFLASRDLEEMWFDRCEYNFCEYGVFMNNAERGIHAPLSGNWNNDFFRESEGCPIRSEIWGMACPGNPRLAAGYAKLDGELDHAGFSVEAEQFLSAAAAAAFTCDTLTETFEAALAALPRDSRTEQVLRHLQTLCAQDTNDAILWRRIMRAYGDRDASKAITNLAIVLAALLRHGGSFEECMTFCYNAGWDTDCTAATAGALLGILHGSAFLPEEWVRKIGTDLSAGISVKHRTAPFSVISEDTARVAVEMAATRNPAIRILNAPEVSVRPEPRRTVEFAVDYPESPVVRPDRPAPAEVRVRNVSGKSLSGIIRLTPEPALAGSGLTVEFTLAAGGEKRFRTEFQWTGNNPAYPPHVVQVDGMVAHGIVMAWIRILVAEPCFVQRLFRAGLCLFEAVDEPAVGALGVAVDSALKRSRRLEDQFLLLVPNSGEIRDLARGESADPDVDVLAGAVRRFRSGLAKFPNHRLQGFHVVPFQNRRHHLGARRAAAEAAVADRLPLAAVRCDHRPFVVASAGEPNLPADHRVDRLGRAFAADVRVLQFRPEGEFLRRLDHRVGHNSAFHRLAC